MSARPIDEKFQVKPFNCQNCKAEIGKTDGRVLETEAARLHLPGEVRCTKCGAFRMWRPIRKAS